MPEVCRTVKNYNDLRAAYDAEVRDDALDLMAWNMTPDSHELLVDGVPTLPTYAFPGGYPLFYITVLGDFVCPSCANDTSKENDPPALISINFEDFLTCDDCGCVIESAYGEE
jgi:hypothetical protein